MSDPTGAILVFTKAPLPGKVKTRLIPALGVSGATGLYLKLLKRMQRLLASQQQAAVEFWCTPDCEHPLLQAFARQGTTLHVQHGADLGERMQHAVRQGLRRYRYVVLIGVDCPVLTTEHIGQALNWLQQGEDAVLGPVEDGGYVLLGLRRDADCLFHGMSWGNAEVAARTRVCLDGLGWSWRELPELWDLDRPEDLPRLKALGWDWGAE